jgi:hypothetical protein
MKAMITRHKDHFIVIGRPMNKTEIKRAAKLPFGGGMALATMRHNQVAIVIDRHELRDFIVEQLGPELIHALAQLVIPID